MLRISIVDTPGQRRLVVEGALLAPWTAEVQGAWRRAGQELQGRKLVIDLTNVTLIGSDGEKMLLDLMNEGAKFLCADVFTKHVLKKLGQRGACAQ